MKRRNELFLALLAFSGSAFANEATLFRTDDVYVCNRYSEKYSYEYEPNCTGFAQRAGRKYQLKTNKMRLRDIEYPKKPKKGWFRILFTGSSILAGPGIEEKFCAPRLFEKRLKLKKKYIEVINGGAEGYFSVRQAIRYQELLPAYSPSISIHYFELSSIANDQFEDALTEYDLDGRPIRFKLPDSVPYTPNFLQEIIDKDPDLSARVQSLPVLAARLRIAWNLWMATDQIEQAMKVTVRSAKFMREEARKANVRFVFVIGADNENINFRAIATHGYSQKIFDLANRFFPSRFTASSEALRSRLEKEGVEAVVLRPGLLPRHFIPGDWHLTEEGSQVLADRFAELAKVNKWIP